MQYLSFVFIAFVVIVFALYYFIPQKFRWIVLLGASLFFYLCYDVRYILFLLFVAISTFCCAKFGRCKRRNKENLILCIVANVCLWFIIKGLPWVGSCINTILRVLFDGYQVQLSPILVPVGISYYVLLAISYLVDVYKKQIKPEKNFLKYLLYLSYFPTIVQGPICKYAQLKKQLIAGNRVGYEKVKSQLLLILIGIIKKMVIADRIAILANYCFANYAELDGAILYIGAVSYSIQLYMDFSGCVDICRGVSALFGIELVDNFNGPYFSKSIKEFWSRWHISLSTWLKDYIYIPLGGNRKGKVRKYINLLITFLVSGIWHGAGVSYIVWGFLQGVYQIVGECSYHLRSKIKEHFKIQPDSLSDRIYRVVITFNLTTFAWIFFRSGRFLSALEYIARMFSSFGVWRMFDRSLFLEGLSGTQYLILVINIVFVFIIDYLRIKRNVFISSCILNCHLVIRWSIYLLLIFDIILFGTYGQGYDMSGFLYGGF